MLCASYSRMYKILISATIEDCQRISRQVVGNQQNIRNLNLPTIRSDTNESTL